jgi:hypothetical protein
LDPADAPGAAPLDRISTCCKTTNHQFIITDRKTEISYSYLPIPINPWSLAEPMIKNARMQEIK